MGLVCVETLLEISLVSQESGVSGPSLEQLCVKETFLSDHSEATLRHTPTTPGCHCWDPSPFTVRGSIKLMCALLDSPHSPDLHSHTGFPH